MQKRNMGGRPKLGALAYTSPITIAISKEARAVLVREGKKNRSLSAFVRQLIGEALESRGVVWPD